MFANFCEGVKVEKGNKHGIGKVVVYLVGFVFVVGMAFGMISISKDGGQWTIPTVIQNKNLQTLKGAKKDDLLICVGTAIADKYPLRWALLVQENKNGNPLGITIDERSVGRVVTDNVSSRISIRDCEVRIVDKSLAYAVAGENLTKGLQGTALPTH